jgi:hypothetical protein
MAPIMNNPKKTLQIEKHHSEVKKAIESLHLFTDKYKRIKKVENLYAFESSAYFGRIVHIHFYYFPVGENKTELAIEAKNKRGKFNKRHDMIEIERHIENGIELFYFSLKAAVVNG